MREGDQMTRPQHFRAVGCKVHHQFARFMNHGGNKHMVGVCGTYLRVDDVANVETGIVPDVVCQKCEKTAARIAKEGTDKK